jgi:hypothetical protein
MDERRKRERERERERAQRCDLLKVAGRMDDA